MTSHFLEFWYVVCRGGPNRYLIRGLSLKFWRSPWARPGPNWAEPIREIFVGTYILGIQVRNLKKLV